MKKSIRFTCMILALVMTACLLTACKGGEPAAPAAPVAPAGDTQAAPAEEAAAPEAAGGIEGSYTLRIGIPTGGKHQQNYFCEQFAAFLADLSGGQVTAELYPAGQLGTTAQMQESILNGSLQGLALPAAYLSSTAPAACVLDIPFLFDYEKGANLQCYRVLNSGTSLDQYLYDQGYEIAAWPLSGMNYFMTIKPVLSMADLSGQKIRCHTSAYIQSALSKTGAVPTIVDTSELATALQNGTIDGLETDIVFACSQKTYELAGNFSFIPMNVSPLVFVLSVEWFETLPEEVKAVIAEAADKALEAEYAYYVDYENACIEEMKAAGVSIVEPDAAFIEALQTATAGVAEQFCGDSEQNAAIYKEFTDLIAADSAAQ